MLTRSVADLDLFVCADARSTLIALADITKDWFRIFLDLDVPGAHGLSLAREIRHLGFHERCCVVSALDRQDLISEVRSMEFLGYLVKARPYVEFAEALGQVFAGESAFPDVVALSKGPAIRLTRKQEYLLDFVRRGLSSKEIANTVFQSEGTINNCINAAAKALGTTNRTHAVTKALELGLLTFNTSKAVSPAQYRQSR